MLEKVNYKPGNESAKKYLLEKERKKQKRNAKKPYEPYLEKIVIALVKIIIRDSSIIYMKNII